MRKLVEEFLSILGAGNERKVHAFLDHNRELLLGITPRPLAIFKEYRLGAEFVVDFVIVQIHGNIDTLHAILVELESPKHRLFTKSGDPSTALTHAIRQTRDWRSWTRNNLRYFSDQLIDKIDAEFKKKYNYSPKEYFPSSVDVSTLVIIGKRASMSKLDRGRLRALWQEENQIIMTYDGLLDRYVGLVEKKVSKRDGDIRG